MRTLIGQECVCMRVCKHGCDDKDDLLFARLACKHELRDECLSQM